jgi:hypothetical protein
VLFKLRVITPEHDPDPLFVFFNPPPQQQHSSPSDITSAIDQIILALLCGEA